MRVCGGAAHFKSHVQRVQFIHFSSCCRIKEHMEPGPDGVQDPAAPHPHLQGLRSVPTFTFWSMSLGLVLTVPLCSSSVSSAGTFEMNQTQSLYEAVENQTITLEWTFTIRRPLRYYQVYCEHITDVRISVVLHVEQGVQFPGSQHPDFTGRVQFDEEVFREGRLRVHVSRLRTTDSGLYQCEVETEHGSSSGKYQLSVSAGTFELNQIQSLYEAVENQTITLEWTFTIRRPLRYYQVYCEHITDVRISVVLHVEHGVQYPDSQDPDFTGRVQFDEEVFREGRLRVHVSRLQTTDSGLYRCEVETEQGSSSGKCRLSISAGTFEMNQTQSLYEAMENQTITLEWTFTIRRPLRYYQVYCEHITGPRISVVLHVEQGVRYPGSQHPDFTGRVQFDEEVFREGRLRVHVSRLQTQDSGLYRCVVKTEYGGSVGKCRLNVSAAANETQTLRPGPERPGPERPGPEIHGRTGLYVVVGLTVVLLVLVTAAAAGRKHPGCGGKEFPAAFTSCRVG
ncbi:uncharacterized protein V6R79_002884 [Siganus canaliculatus]